MEKRIYGLDDGLQARALASLGGEGDSENVAFLIGTQSLRAPNQIHLLSFDEEEDSLGVTIFNHDVGEVWDIATPASSKDLATTCHYDATAKSSGATVWAIPEVARDDDGVQELTKLFSLDCGSRPQSSLWHPQETSSLVTVCADELQLWDVNVGASTATLKHSAKAQAAGEAYASCRWNPHHSYAYVASASGKNLRGCDLRSMEQTFCIEKAHSNVTVRNLDFNPNKQYNMLSCGDDGKVKFWDVRSPDKALLEFSSHHSHWVWSARYNHFHDQLIISSSSDNQVALSNAGSLSSGLLEHLEEEEDDDEDEASKPQPDGLILTYEEHEDSVYCVEWSITDAWVFASLSYDGRFILNSVPNDIKYGILL